MCAAYTTSPNATNDDMHGVSRPAFTDVPHQGMEMRKGEKDDRCSYMYHKQQQAPVGVLLGRYETEGLPSQLLTTDGDRSHATRCTSWSWCRWLLWTQT